MGGSLPVHRKILIAGLFVTLVTACGSQQTTEVSSSTPTVVTTTVPMTSVPNTTGAPESTTVVESSAVTTTMDVETLETLQILSLRNVLSGESFAPLCKSMMDFERLGLSRPAIVDMAYDSVTSGFEQETIGVLFPASEALLREALADCFEP